MPSAIVEEAAVISRPSRNDSARAGLPAAWTPITRRFGRSAFAATAMPEISPPPPTGTTIASSSGPSASSSSATVPCPAITSGSSKAWT